MKYEIKGDFGEITEQAMLLKYLGIDVVMNDGITYFENGEDAIRMMTLFANWKLPGYLVDLQNHIIKLSKDTINSAKKEEEYQIKQDETGITIYNSARSFKIAASKGPDGFNNYELIFSDYTDNLDINYLKTREISYYFKKDSFLYDLIKRFKNSTTGILKEIDSEDKTLTFKEEDGIYMIFNKNTNLKSKDDNKINIGNPFNNNSWLSVDNLYNQSLTRIKLGDKLENSNYTR